MQERKIIIYKATNKINGKGYVGQTVRTLEERKVEHKRKANKNTDSYFHRAINKYGVATGFIWKELCICNGKEEANRFEIGLIKRMGTRKPSGYNCTSGGEGPHRFKQAAEVCATNSKRMMGNKIALGLKRTDETKAKMSKAGMGNTNGSGNKGTKHTPEQNATMSKAMTGRKQSAETKAKRAASRKRTYELRLQAELINGRKCIKCEEVKPLTSENFTWLKKQGCFRGECKECRREYYKNGRKYIRK